MKKLIGSLLLFSPITSFALGCPRSFKNLESMPTPPSYVGIGLLATLLCAISVCLIVRALFLKSLSKTIRPRHTLLYVLLFIAAMSMIVWTGVKSGDMYVFVFNLRGILAGVLAGLISSKLRKPLTAERIWENTLFHALLHG